MADTGTTGTDKDDFQKDAVGLATRWQTELSAAKKALKPFQDKGAHVVKVYLDERGEADAKQTKWNLFHGNVQQQLAMLYANRPASDVTRRYGDAKDDVGRIAGELGERVANADFEKRGDTTEEAIGNAIEDWRLPGLGVVWLRLEVQEKVQPAQKPLMRNGMEVPGTAVPAVPTAKRTVGVDYVHWRDFLWT